MTTVDARYIGWRSYSTKIAEQRVRVRGIV